jgi:hypothetical protein
MRDTIRPNAIRSLINEIAEEIPEYLSDINIEKRPNIKQGLKRMLLSMRLEKTIAHYSIGDDKAIVTQSLLELISGFEEIWENETGQEYEYALWIVSLAVLCDIDNDSFKRITDKLQQQKLNDVLFSFIIRSKQESWRESTKKVANELVVKPYNRVIALDTTADIKNYLNNYWYKENSESPWHDQHKNKKVNNYFGYWAWEVAAIAKIKGIDDNSLQNQKYYPFDAANW